MNLIEQGQSLNMSDIQKTEEEFGLKFPKEYIDFLLKNNGGVPEEEIEFKFLENDKDSGKKQVQGSDIQYFYNNDEILKTYNNLFGEKLIKKEFVPIACDSFGNEILIYLGKIEKYGALYFAYHDKISTEEDLWQVSFIVNSFNNFLDLLKPIDE